MYMVLFRKNEINNLRKDIVRVQSMKCNIALSYHAIIIFH